MPKQHTKPPAPPYEGFPLWPHKGSGQWCRKIAGRHHYFGSWRTGDWKAALAKFEDERDALYAGVVPASRRTDCVADVANAYLADRLRAVEAAEMTRLSWNGARRTLAVVVESLGRRTPLSGVSHDAWSVLRSELAVGVRAETLKQRLGIVQSWLNWAHRTGVLTHKLSTPALRAPKMSMIRKQRAERGALIFDRDEVRALLDGADATIRACILLGVNCGIAAADIDALKWRHIDRQGLWLNQPRHKTGLPRRAKLWGRTLKALEAAAVDRKPDSVILRGPRGNRLGSDAAGGHSSSYLGKVMRRLCDDAGIHRPGRSFHGLRRTFSTIANETGDSIAVSAVMGHVIAGDEIASLYRTRVDDGRLERISTYVESWLFGRQRRN